MKILPEHHEAADVQRQGGQNTADADPIEIHVLHLFPDDEEEQYIERKGRPCGDNRQKTPHETDQMHAATAIPTTDRGSLRLRQQPVETPVQKTASAKTPHRPAAVYVATLSTATHGPRSGGAGDAGVVGAWGDVDVSRDSFLGGGDGDDGGGGGAAGGDGGGGFAGGLGGGDGGGLGGGDGG
eukprot:CAMPEP_0179944222 /NCGR_PEP_ID=MMETSP0983-20121128/18852_1 /TAXON_ID=483367 /ORGANISM="non described non described, Strain CCMP 2436" /LENGTH=182 /DNA_ID=CAMNT_0021852211 /DNA_START=623 /DNA_END=1168 /DNA_ORIENTATION=+